MHECTQFINSDVCVHLVQEESLINNTDTSQLAELLSNVDASLNRTSEVLLKSSEVGSLKRRFLV